MAKNTHSAEGYRIMNATRQWFIDSDVRHSWAGTYATDQEIADARAGLLERRQRERQQTLDLISTRKA